MKFDRNNFKEFAIRNEQLEIEKCSSEHVYDFHSIFKHIKWEHSFKHISDSELSKKYLYIGSLRDERIERLNYIEFNNKDGEYWSPTAKIATNFYPYHNCDVYRCNECKKLFLVYVETAGHGPQQRIRLVKPELIVEEPSNCTIEILPSQIPHLLEIIKFTGNFNEYLESNKNTDRINTDFNINDILIKRTSSDYYLIVAKREKLYEITDLLNNVNSR